MSSWHRLAATTAAITLGFGLAACAGGGGSSTGSSTGSGAGSSPAAVATPSPSGSTGGEPVLRAYEFPGGMIEGLAGRSDKTYTRVEGLLAVPSGTG